MITQTEVYRQLKSEIDKIPAIDTHVHLDVKEPLARDLAKVLYYHNYIQELIAGGAPEALVHNQNSDGREKTKMLLSEMKRSPCSVHAWMLREVLRIVYDFEEELTDKNWEKLHDRAGQARKKPGRLKELCRLAGVEKILVHLPAQPAAQIGYDDSIFTGLSDLYMPNMLTRKELARVESQTGVSVGKAGDYLEAVVSYLKRAAACGQRGLRVSIAPTLKVLRPGASAVESAFDRAINGKTPAGDDKAALETFVLDAAITGAAETGMVVQVFVEGSFLGNCRIPSAEQVLVCSLWDLVAGHPRVNFDVFSISAPLIQTLCLFSKYVKNVYLPGVWWLCQFPEIMRSTYSLRFEMLPSSKWSVFFSDAYEVEWIIGKAALTRKELARSLASKVIDGYMSEENAVFCARQVLFETPRQLYKL